MASDPCRCGTLGCLETLASSRAVVDSARALALESGHGGLARAPEAITFDSLVQAFEAGDPVARRVVTGAGRYMRQAVPGLMGALNVQRIVIAGETARFGPPRLDVIRDTMPRTTLARLAGKTSVDFEHLGHNEIILGASALILRDYSLAFRRQPGRPEGHVERGPRQSAGASAS